MRLISVEGMLRGKRQRLMYLEFTEVPRVGEILEVEVETYKVTKVIRVCKLSKSLDGLGVYAIVTSVVEVEEC